jgi:hypothetical protein
MEIDGVVIELQVVVIDLEHCKCRVKLFFAN